MSDDVVIHVRLADDTSGERAKLKASLATDGTVAGKEYADKARESIGGSAPAKMPVKAADPIDQAWRAQVQASINSIVKDAVKIPVTPDTAQYREELKLAVGELQSAVKQKMDVDVDHADAFRLRVEELAKEVQSEVKLKLEPTVEPAAAKAAATGAGGLWTVLGPVLAAGAPLVGAAAGAALIGGLGLGLVGAAAVVAASNSKIKQQFGVFGADLKTAAASWGLQVQQPISQALGTIQAEFQQLRPAIGQAFGNLSPDIKILGSAFADFGSNVMPGVVTSSSKLIPVFQGIDSLSSQLGASLGTMFSDLSAHSTTLGTSFTLIGQTVSSLLGTLTPLVGDLTDVFAHTGGTLVATLTSMGNVIDGVAHTALPALGGGIQADLGILNAFMGAIGPASSLLGVFGGTALSAYMNVSLLSKLKGPIDSAATSLENAGTKGTTFGDVTSKVSKGLSKVGDSLPYVGIGLSLIGTAMDLDSQHANDLADASDKLAASLEQGGASGVLARHQLDDLRKQAYDATTAIGDLEIQQTQGTQTSSQYGDMAGSNARDIAGLSEKIQDNKQVADSALQKYNDWTAKMGLTAITAAQLSGNIDILSVSSQSASSNTSQLKADLDILDTAAATADQKVKALSDSLAILGDHGLQKAQDYAAQFGTALDTFTSQAQTAKGAVFTLNGQLDTNSARGRDVLTVLEQTQQSWAGQAQAMADAGVSQAAINQALQVNRDRLSAVLQAAGLTKDEVQRLLDTYGLIPKDIGTKVHADTQGAKDDTVNLIRWINGLRAVVTVDTVTGNTTAISPSGRSGRNTTASAQGGVTSFPGAASGMALGSGWRIVGEQGAEAIRDAVGATVTPRSGVDKVITDALAQGGGGGPTRFEVSASGDEVSQLLAFLIKKFVRIYGGGSVQTAFGGTS